MGLRSSVMLDKEIARKAKKHRVFKKDSVTLPQMTANEFALNLALLRPHGAQGCYRFKWDYLLSELNSKLNDPSAFSADVKRENAYVKVDAGELTMLEQNRRKSIFRDVDSDVHQVLVAAQAKLAVLFRNFSVGCLIKGSFSEGATTSRVKVFGNPVYKWGFDFAGGFAPGNNSERSRFYKKEANISDKPLDVTARAYKYVCALQSVVSKQLPSPRILADNANVVTTVPKKTDCDRTIAKEPDWNMFFQRAVGKYLRKQLLTVGINLNDQGVNQKLAHEGSVYGNYATIDLKNASNSLSYRTVIDLIPFSLFSVMDDLRAIRGTFIGRDNSYHDWQMFSTMGNGFTFELQSAIYWAITASVCDTLKIPSDYSNSGNPRESVFGDDIIIPTAGASLLIKTLNSLGFSVNPEKTFLEGPFRESCGKHYYEGNDVSPFYIKEEPSTVQDWVRILNRLRAWAYDSAHDICDDSVWPLWRCLYKSISISREISGGFDTDRIDMIASPGKPKGHMVFEQQKRLFSGSMLYCTIAQDLQDDVGRHTYCRVRSHLNDGDPLVSTSSIEVIYTLARFSIKRTEASQLLTKYFGNEVR